MNTPKVIQLSSGSWHTTVWNGEKRVSVTEPTKELAEARAIEIQTAREAIKKSRKAYSSSPCKTAYRDELFKNRHQGQYYVSGRYIEKERVVDKDITLKKLYKHDEGICHICGKKCDLEDYWYMTGKTGKEIFVAGDNYPVIDHVIPLNKGGVQSWENVKLAHKACNTKKGDALPYPTTADLYHKYKKEKFTNMSDAELLAIVRNEMPSFSKDGDTALHVLINQRGYEIAYADSAALLLNDTTFVLEIPNFSIYDYLFASCHFLVTKEEN